MDCPCHLAGCPTVAKAAEMARDEIPSTTSIGPPARSNGRPPPHSLPTCPIDAGDNPEQVTGTGLAVSHPTAIAHVDSIRDAGKIQEEIAAKQRQERQDLAAVQIGLFVNIQVAANIAARTVLDNTCPAINLALAHHVNPQCPAVEAAIAEPPSV